MEAIMQQTEIKTDFDLAASRERCMRYRRRILDILNR